MNNKTKNNLFKIINKINNNLFNKVYLIPNKDRVKLILKINLMHLIMNNK